MTHRITSKVGRSSPVSILVNGEPVVAYEGESIATALLACGVTTMTRDSAGRLRGPFCNMGVCCDCIVMLEDGSADTDPVRVKSCLATVRDGIRVTTPGHREAGN